MSDLETIKAYLEDEQARADKCEDEYTKQLLLNRCASYERMIKELTDDMPNNASAEG